MLTSVLNVMHYGREALGAVPKMVASLDDVCNRLYIAWLNLF